MRKHIITATVFAACLALCAAVWPQTDVVEETPIPTQTTTMTAPQPTFPELEELEITVITEKETVIASEIELTPESTVEELPTPTPDTEKQPESERESAPPTQPESEPTPEPEASNNSSEDMVYVPGFGWIENQGPNHVEYAEDMYENGNKIGIMG